LPQPSEYSFALVLQSTGRCDEADCSFWYILCKLLPEKWQNQVMPIAPAPHLDVNVGPIWFCPPASFDPTLGQSVGGYLVQAKRWALHQLFCANVHDRFDISVQLSQAGEARYDIPGQALAALGDLLTEHTRLAGYQDYFFIIALGFLLHREGGSSAETEKENACTQRRATRCGRGGAF
jgi:hypothetical protein